MTRTARTVVAAGVVMLAQGVVGAQGPTFRSTTELVNLNVTVVDAESRPVPGLSADQFQVFEDGVPQQVEFFAAGEMPLDVLVLLDTSASMTASMPLVQSAAAGFIRALRPHDRAAVMGIAGGLRVLQPMTGDKPALIAAIGAARPGGRTPLYAAIYTALHELEKIRRLEDHTSRRQAIVVLSDGQDTASAFGFDDLMERVHRQAVPIYPIAPRPSATIRAHREAAFGENTHEQDYELRKLAADTGARAFFPVTLQQLAGVYDEIANELAHQYSLGYHPAGGSGGAEYRRIALRVTAPGVQWRTRAGYMTDGRRRASAE